MKRFRVIIERPARDDIEHYLQRAAQAGAELNAARWYNRLIGAVLGLEELPEWRSAVPEQHEFEVKLYEVVFERRYRIIYTVIEDRVHTLCVRGAGMRELVRNDIDWLP